MKKKSILSTLVLAVFFIGFNQLTSNPLGAPAGYSGSPADGQTCTSCHGGTANAATNVLTSNVPNTGYVAEATYTITVTVSGSSARKGFEVSPQNTNGTLIGTIAAGTGSKIVGSKYITHSAAKTTNPGVWTFTWTAPAKGSGAVNFYGAFVNGYTNVSKQVMTIAEDAGTPNTPPAVSATTVLSVSNTSVNLEATINANGKTFNTAFLYKDLVATNWNLVLASPTTVSGNTATTISHSITTLNAGTTYMFKACAYNAGDSTFGIINTFKTTNNPTAIKEVNTLVLHTIYPNPSIDNMSIGFNLPQKTMVEITAISLDGKVSQQLLNEELNAGNQIVLVNTTELPAGVYFVVLKANNILVTKKIIIQ
jgi:hypothetical protein